MAGKPPQGHPPAGTSAELRYAPGRNAQNLPHSPIDYRTHAQHAPAPPPGNRRITDAASPVQPPGMPPQVNAMQPPYTGYGPPGSYASSYQGYGANPYFGASMGKFGINQMQGQMQQPMQPPSMMGQPQQLSPQPYAQAYQQSQPQGMPQMGMQSGMQSDAPSLQMKPQMQQPYQQMMPQQMQQPMQPQSAYNFGTNQQGTGYNVPGVPGGGYGSLQSGPTAPMGGWNAQGPGSQNFYGQAGLGNAFGNGAMPGYGPGAAGAEPYNQSTTFPGSPFPNMAGRGSGAGMGPAYQNQSYDQWQQQRQQQSQLPFTTYG